MVAHQDDTAAALPIGARALAQARRNPRGMPADYTSKPVSGFNAQPTPATANLRSNCRTRACSNFNCCEFGSAIQEVFDRFGGRESELL